MVAFGHALAGVRVQRVHKVQRVQRVVVAAGAANKKGARLRRRLWRRVVFASLRGRRPFGPRIVVAPSAQFYRPPLGLLWHACHFSCLPTPSTAHAVPLPLQAGGGRLKVHKRPSLHKRGSAGASGDKAISITSPCTILMNQPPAAAFPPLVPVGTTFPPLCGGTINRR